MSPASIADAGGKPNPPLKKVEPKLHLISLLKKGGAKTTSDFTFEKRWSQNYI
jgi:hypothetical protein